jgi:hypothetical protein
MSATVASRTFTCNEVVVPRTINYSRCAGGVGGGGVPAPAGAGVMAGGGSSVRHTACELFITVSVVPPQQ